MRNPYGNALPAEDRSAELGSVAVPLLLLSVILAGAAFSALGYAVLWQAKAKLQLRLDRCVESAALELATVQNAIDAANFRMKAERAAAAAAAAPSLGASVEAAQSVLAVEVAFQEAQRIRWIARQTRWIAERGCDRRGDRFLPLPNLRWTRPPSDALGPRPLEWDGDGARLELRLWRANRFSRARVSREERNEGNEGIDSTSGLRRWKAAWTRSRPGLD